MWRVFLLSGVIACSSSSDEPPDPDREADVLIEAPDNVVVIFRDGDGDWQLAPLIDTRYGFDIESEFYAVAFIDASLGSVDAVYATLDEERDFKIPTVAPTPPTQPVTGTVSGIDETLLFAALVAVGGERMGLFNMAGTQTFALDVPEGSHTVAASKFDDDMELSSIAVRRDVLITGPTDLTIDLATESVPTVEATLDGPTSLCQYIASIVMGDAGVGLSSSSSPIAIIPDPDQWRAQDLMTVTLQCKIKPDVLVIQSYNYAAPSELTQTIESGSSAGSATFAANQFTWSSFEAPVLRGVVAGAPCMSEFLAVEDFVNAGCTQRWNARVTTGWAGINGEQLDLITQAELEAVGAWDPALELPTPLTWTFESRVESSNAVIRNIRAETLP